MDKETITNKDLSKRLHQYFLEQDPSVVAFLLAHAMIDLHRLYNIASLPLDEAELLLERMIHNSQQLLSFAKNGPNGDLKVSKING